MTNVHDQQYKVRWQLSNSCKNIFMCHMSISWGISGDSCLLTATQCLWWLWTILTKMYHGSYTIELGKCTKLSIKPNISPTPVYLSVCHGCPSPSPGRRRLLALSRPQWKSRRGHGRGLSRSFLKGSSGDIDIIFEGKRRSKIWRLWIVFSLFLGFT